MGSRIELREGQRFYNRHTGKRRRIVALTAQTIYPKLGCLLDPPAIKEHVIYSTGGDRNYSCRREQFLRFINTGAEDVTGKPVIVAGGLL